MDEEDDCSTEGGLPRGVGSSNTETYKHMTYHGPSAKINVSGSDANTLMLTAFTIIMSLKTAAELVRSKVVALPYLDQALVGCR